MAAPNEVTFRLSRCRSSVPKARAVLRAKLGEWRAGQAAAEESELVLSGLVSNALRVPVPGDRLVGVRIECRGRGELLRLEVSDAGEGRPEVRRPGELDKGGRGLLLVETLAHRWGVDERRAGIGKTVWAELLAPGIGPAPVEVEIAAVTVRPGQCVRAWGAWHTVRAVRSEWYASGGLAIVIVLDDGGPALRLDAADPLTVRAAEPARSRVQIRGESGDLIVKALWKRFSQRQSHRARPRSLGTLMQMVGGELVVISRAGEPVERALRPRPKVRRQGRGSLRGRIRIPANFDDAPASVAEALGMR
ncbi:hypothetical protein GCM10010433_07840 [Streptomyces pulveraceus]|uniref:ATP-binding protein n=1 Tax=Streptomyces pulveraceus TaxID=68258 RepID=A0ABW1GJG1_9ACTN